MCHARLLHITQGSPQAWNHAEMHRLFNGAPMWPSSHVNQNVLLYSVGSVKNSLQCLGLSP